jgi:hypothetical protein
LAVELPASDSHANRHPKPQLLPNYRKSFNPDLSLVPYSRQITHHTMNSRGDDMEGFDRRKFLKGSSVAAGLAGAMTVLPGALPAFAKTTQVASRSSAKDSDEVGSAGANAGAGATSEPIVAHIRDAGNGQIDLFIGTRHVTVRDRNLTNRILNAAN